MPPSSLNDSSLKRVRSLFVGYGLLPHSSRHDHISISEEAMRPYVSKSPEVGELSQASIWKLGGGKRSMESLLPLPPSAPQNMGLEGAFLRGMQGRSGPM